MTRATGVFRVREASVRRLPDEASMAPWEGIAVRTSFLAVDGESDAPVTQGLLRPYPSFAVHTLCAARAAITQGGIVGVVLGLEPESPATLAFVDQLRAEGDCTPIVVLTRTNDLRRANEWDARHRVRCFFRDDAAANVRRFVEETTHVPTDADVDLACRTFERRYLLTHREAQVLRAVVRIAGSAAIGRELNISTRTAEGHVQRILGKTGMSSRDELIIAILGPVNRPRHA